MTTNTVYHGFALEHEDLNKELTGRVLQAAPVARLYLLGLTVTHRRAETLFSMPFVSRRVVSHYYLLALVENKEEERCLSAIQDKIENNLQHFVPVTAIVLSAVLFRDWLWEDHPFASAVATKALLLHADESSPMPSFKPSDGAKHKLVAAQLLAKAKAQVQAFVAGVELYTLRKEYKPAAFMLHQATEHALSALLTINTGLRVQTHNIDKLVRYCALFCYEVQDIFPKATEKEKHLFSLLQKAYIDARYKEDYTIRFEELQTLTERVKRLQHILNNSL